MKKNISKKKSDNKPEVSGKIWLLRLLVLHIASIIIYMILAYFLRQGPNVMIDESLYTNISKGIAWNGTLTYRDQPVNYPFILYPLLLVPVYRIQALLGSGDIYRWVQFFNIVLITSSIYPVFLFAVRFTRDYEKSFLAACITAIMPDMLIGSFEMTEPLLWVLLLWNMNFAQEMLLSDSSKKWPVLMGLFTGLAFFTKPGSVAMGLCILLTEMVLVLKNRNKQGIRKVLTAACSLLCVVIFVYVLYFFIFHYDISILGLYAKQTSNWQPNHILAAIEGCIMMVFVFVFACVGIFAVLPYFHMDHYTAENRKIILASTVGLSAVMLGVGLLVIPFQWNGDYLNIPVHLRYVAMFIPIWFIFSLPVIDTNKKMAPGFVIVMIIFIALSIFPGVRIGLSKGGSSSVDSLALSAFMVNDHFRGYTTGWMLTIFVIFFALALCFAVQMNIQGKGFFQFCLVFFIFSALFNHICACKTIKVSVDPGVTQDANELNKILEDTEKPLLGVIQKKYSSALSVWEECHLNRPMQQVTVDQMFNEMKKTQGIYEPFIPIRQSPNVNMGYTPNARTLVLGQSIAEHLEVSENVKTQTTTNGTYTLVTLNEGERWVDTMMYGMDDRMLEKGSFAVIVCFDPDKIGSVLTLQVFNSSPDTVMTIASGGITEDFPLEENRIQTIETIIRSHEVIITATESIDINRYITRPLTRVN